MTKKYKLSKRIENLGDNLVDTITGDAFELDKEAKKLLSNEVIEENEKNSHLIEFMLDNNIINLNCKTVLINYKI